MKKIAITLTVASLIIIVSAVPTATAGAAFPDRPDGPLIITEVLPGDHQSASQEFIEIYNQSAQTINLGDQKWEVQLTTSKATAWEKAKTIPLAGKLYPGGYMLLASNYVADGESKSYLQDYASARFSPGLTGVSGHVRIGSKTQDVFASSDIVEWTTISNGTEVSPGIDSDPVVLSATIAAGESIKRLPSEGIFSEVMYGVSTCPTPTAYNIEQVDIPLGTSVKTAIDIDNPLCIEEPEEVGDIDGGVLAPSVVPPATLLPAATPVAARSTIPTMPASNKGLRAPQITELLANPLAPQTDAQHEFIELYNENAAGFDLSGSKLIIGTNGSRTYTFPKGTVIPGRTFKAFFSADTHIGLSNSGGRVSLAAPDGSVLHASEPYAAAKEGNAWAVGGGKWQWTTKPTPNASNVIAAPVGGSSKKASSTAKTKTASTLATTAQVMQNNAQGLASDIKPDRPIHPMALAAVGVFAVLYGAYEYRRDVANKFFQLRSYRAARREARQELEGR